MLRLASHLMPDREICAVKGTVAEDRYRRISGLVNRNNIRFTVAFAESYRKTDFKGRVYFADPLLFGSRAIGYFLL